MRNAKKVPVIPVNPNRVINKFKRKKGQKYIQSLKIDEKTFSQINDPFFKIKGMERVRKIKEYICK